MVVCWARRRDDAGRDERGRLAGDLLRFVGWVRRTLLVNLYGQAPGTTHKQEKETTLSQATRRTEHTLSRRGRRERQPMARAELNRNSAIDFMGWGQVRAEGAGIWAHGWNPFGMKIFSCHDLVLLVLSSTRTNSTMDNGNGWQWPGKAPVADAVASPLAAPPRPISRWP
jgi:hypothetical protein